MRAAFSKVAGLPAATHIGGCGLVAGLGRTFRGGIEKNRPSNAYSVSRHIRWNWGTTSSNICRVRSGSRMPNPRISMVDDPRPIPNSKRPWLRLSSIATRSATRAGWLTGGVTLKIPVPMWMRRVSAAT